ncbi:glycosyl transferase, partial [Kitasatospora sp. NPDC036755]
GAGSDRADGRHERGSGTDGAAGNGGFPGGQAFPGGTDGGPPPGGMGGLLDGPKVTPEVAAMLSEGADRYTWAAATIGSQTAAGYQLATGEPVMALGGFNGTDPSLTLAGFQKYVQEGKVHWFIGAGGSHRGFGDDEGGQQSESARIESWVTAHFTARTVGSTSFYDLTAPTS